MKQFSNLKRAFLPCLFVLLTLPAWGQMQPVTKNFRKTPLKNVLKEVEAQTGLSIMYDTRELNLERPVTASFDRTPVSQVLREVLDRTVQYSIKDKMIVIYKASATPPPMAKAAEGIDCGMTAVLGLDRAALAECCEQAVELGCVQICNYNCPGQLVIGGEKAAVDKAAERAKAAGARRCIPLKVSGPFHTRLMAPAGDALAERFRTENFGEMKIPVLFNCLGREKADTDTVPALLVKQVQSSVHMEDTLRRLGELGVDHILEVGPGSALSGFVKKTLPGVPCVAVETPEQLDAALNAWKEEA